MSLFAEHARLVIDFRSEWHAGSGEGSGYHLDALCRRDQGGLPVLPGRQLRGVMRHAVYRAEQWGWLLELELPEGPASDHESLLFGTRSGEEGRSATQPGMLVIGNASLPWPEREWLAAPDRGALREALFEERFATAIEAEGSAAHQSLRGMEVCIPVTLHAALALEQTALDPELRAQQVEALAGGSAWSVIERVLPLLDAFGAHRNRGLGEAEVALIRMQERDHA